MKTFALAVSAAGLLSGLAWGAPNKVEPAQTVTLARVEARLFYEGTGVLSDNIASPASFRAWNTMIGEGDAKQPANDLLVTATLSSVPAEASVTTPLTIAVINEKGRTIAKRRFKSLYFKNGLAVKALFVPDAACIGKATIKATFGVQRRVSNVELSCGE